jgi:hypothetical protein
MLDNACRRVNQLAVERPDLVKAGYDNIAKALHMEA